MEDKTGLFNSFKLGELHSVVKENSKGIAESNLRLMKLDDDIIEVKDITQQIQEDILEMRKLNLEIREISLEMRKGSHEIRLLLDEAIANNEKIRRDIDKMKSADSKNWIGREIGVM